ncbi:TlpA disulfide reductase family protein [Mucilaginibacter sp. CAU 1740]|uniref:TlpA family protein disulfide reductase n=1 Tax=Mucilaginibacter sp. CAU 1740 TaxID=3140365 RepID=UPI00325B3A8F
MKNLLLLVLAFLGCSAQLSARQKTTRIDVATDFSREGDSLTITVRRYTGRLDEIAGDFNAVCRKGKFTLAIPARGYPQYIQVQFHRPSMRILEQLLLFPGDDMAMVIQDGQFRFTGPSAQRFLAQQRLQSISDSSLRRNRLRFTPSTLPRIFAHTDSAAIASLEYLDGMKTRIGPEAWALLSDNVKASAACIKLGYFNYAAAGKPEAGERYKTALQQYGKPLNSFPSFLAADSLGNARSGYSVDYIYQHYLADSCILMHRKFQVHDFYQYASRNFKGEIRELLVTNLFIIKRTNPELRTADINNALDYVKNSDLRTVLKKILAANTVGAMAPAFTLPDGKNRLVSLKDFRGKLVILDFWFTGCGACRELAPRMHMLEKKYAGRPVVFITVSVDKKRGQWLATLKTNAYTSALSVNLYTGGKGYAADVVREYDVRGCPTVVLIDKDGKLGPKPVLEVEEMSKLIDSYL